MNEAKIREIIAQLTLEEKAALCSGADSWTTKANPAKGIPTLRMADGPHGVRREDKQNAEANGGPSVPATCFPPAATLACSWSPALAEEVGTALGEECRDQGVHMLLGPGVNIKRSPLGGRNFEYFSEDPLLAGEMGAGWINGVQSRGVGTSLKHYAANNQETKRMSVNAVVDERAFHDIYLKPFEIAVKQSKPATVMASYNKINGTYSCENRPLLTDILRLRFGFDGAVVSDWGAVHGRAKGIFAGLDLEMPGSGGVNDAAIVQAVQDGNLSEDALDTACWNLLRLIFTYAEKTETAAEAGGVPPCDYAAHHELAAKALCQSAVLLRNEGVLPFDESQPLLVIGNAARKPVYQGGGSSVVNPKHLTCFTEALDAAGQPYAFEEGFAPGGWSFAKTGEPVYHKPTHLDALRQKAVEAAKTAKQVVLFIAREDQVACEGYDSPGLGLAPEQEALIEEVARANPNTCVVLCCPAPVASKTLLAAPAVLCLHLGGQNVGEGARRLLFGKASPGGKLAESWPISADATPEGAFFPMGPRTVTYAESLYVGYRYYTALPDDGKSALLFPFGHGLSYTSFAYSGLGATQPADEKNGDVTLTFTLKNTGGAAGSEIAQVYVEKPASAMWQPGRQLVGYTRVALAPGEEKQVTLTIPYGRFGGHDPASHTHVVEAGAYRLFVGGGSTLDALPLRAEVTLGGVNLAPAPAHAKDAPYGKVPLQTRESLPAYLKANFPALYGAPMPTDAPRKRGEYTMDTTVGEMKDSPLVRQLSKIGLRMARKTHAFSKDPFAAEYSMRCGVQDFPFKNIVLFSDGIIDHTAAQWLLDAANGHGGLGKALLRIRRSYAARRKPR